MTEYDRIANTEDESGLDQGDQMSNELVLLMEDKDILQSHIEASKETVDSKIGDKETEIQRALGDDWKNTETKILEEQHHRNRNVVEEIIKTCEEFKEDISKFLSCNEYCV